MNWHTHNDRRSFAGNPRNFDVSAKDRSALTHAEQPRALEAARVPQVKFQCRRPQLRARAFRHCASRRTQTLPAFEWRATLVSISWKIRKTAVACSRLTSTSSSGMLRMHETPPRLWKSFAWHSIAAASPRSSSIPGRSSLWILRTTCTVSSIASCVRESFQE